MPKRKTLPKITQIVGIPKDKNKLMVQKSNPLMLLSETSMTLPELKILDAYLSRIDSHNEEKRLVRLEKGELERLLGVTRILKEDLDKRLRNLFQVIEIYDDNGKGFTILGLFEKAKAYQDDDGLWLVDLCCTESAREYIFNIDNIGYLRYRLKNIIDLTSRYSYVLYLYLENNRFRKSWEIDIDELKQMLNCTAETYSQYKRFNDLILKKCHKELNEKTNLKYSYEPCQRKGRKYTAIRFTLETASDYLDSDENQLTFDDVPEPTESEYDIDDKFGLLASAVNNEFTRTQMEEIFSIICTMDVPENENGIDIARYHFLDKYYKHLNAQAECNAQNGKPIKNRYAYFIAMLKKYESKE